MPADAPISPATWLVATPFVNGETGEAAEAAPPLRMFDRRMPGLRGGCAEHIHREHDVVVLIRVVVLVRVALPVRIPVVVDRHEPAGRLAIHDHWLVRPDAHRAVGAATRDVVAATGCHLTRRATGRGREWAAANGGAARG